MDKKLRREITRDAQANEIVLRWVRKLLLRSDILADPDTGELFEDDGGRLDLEMVRFAQWCDKRAKKIRATKKYKGER